MRCCAGVRPAAQQVRQTQMSRTNRNFIFAYALLVVLPLLGLAGVLKSGRRLAAPPAVDGLWSVHLETAASNTSPCSAVSDSLLPKSISISQSGTSFVLAVPGSPRIAAYGTVNGNSLHATWTAPAATPTAGFVDPHNCSGQAFYLLANLDRATGASVLTGSFSAADCPSCTPVAFRAERQSNATAQEGR